jgi:hypothetical protein
MARRRAAAIERVFDCGLSCIGIVDLQPRTYPVFISDIVIEIKKVGRSM